MMKSDYQINSGNITSHSEETSAVSKIGYEIENANNNNLGVEKNQEANCKVTKKGQFP